MRFGEELGAFVGRCWVTEKEIGCRVRSADLGDLSIELAVLLVEESAEGGEIVGGDGVEKKVVGRGHFVFQKGKIFDF